MSCRGFCATTVKRRFGGLARAYELRRLRLEEGLYAGQPVARLCCLVEDGASCLRRILGTSACGWTQVLPAERSIPLGRRRSALCLSSTVGLKRRWRRVEARSACRLCLGYSS